MVLSSFFVYWMFKTPHTIKNVCLQMYNYLFLISRHNWSPVFRCCGGSQWWHHCHMYLCHWCYIYWLPGNHLYKGQLTGVVLHKHIPSWWSHSSKWCFVLVYMYIKDAVYMKLLKLLNNRHTGGRTLVLRDVVPIWEMLAICSHTPQLWGNYSEGGSL